MQQEMKLQKLKKLCKDFKTKQDRINIIIFSTISLIAIISTLISIKGSGLAFLGIFGAIILILLIVGIMLWFSKKGILYFAEINTLVHHTFGAVSNKDKEIAQQLALLWRENYMFHNIIFKDINIVRSIIIILLTSKISQQMQMLANGVKLEKTECQAFCKTLQKQVDFILKGKKDNKEIDMLYQQSCFLLNKNSYILE